MKKLITIFLFFMPLYMWSQRAIVCGTIDSSKTIYTYFMSYNYYIGSSASGSGNIFFSSNNKKVDRDYMNLAADCIKSNSQFTHVVFINLILTDTIQSKKSKQ